ncbi:hypothetical protein PTKIN_Ptkin07bG0101400 [Pterospermum kingtungense]
MDFSNVVEMLQAKAMWLSLGERSRLLLKNLLDGATKRVLDTHKKIIAAAEYGVCGTPCPSESEKCRALSEFQPYVSPNVLKGALDVSNHHAFNSVKDKDTPNKLTPHEVSSLQSRLSFSYGPENRKKRCEFNKQSSIKQHSTARSLSKESKEQGQRCDPLGHFHQASGDERKLLDRTGKNIKVVNSNKTMRLTSIRRLHLGTPSVVASVAGSSRSLACRDDLASQDNKEGEAVNNFSKDVDNVLEHIESHISALRLCSKLADAKKGSVPHCLANMPESVPPILQTKEHLVKKSELSQAFEPFSDRNKLLLSRPESQIIRKKDDSNGSHRVLDQIENDMTSKRRRIQHKEIGETCKHVVRTNGRLNKKAGNSNLVGMVEAGGHRQSQNTGCYVHGPRVPIKQDDITKRPPVPVKRPYAIPMSNAGKESTSTVAKMRPQISSQSAGSKASVRPLADKKNLAHHILPKQKEGHNGILQNKILLHQQESEESTTSSTDSSDSEAYSLLSQDSATSISSRSGHGVSEESISSTSSDYRDVSESGRSYPTRTHKLISPANSEREKAEGQRVGRLRRFKNKLGLIFHHHHHHHHHNYDEDDSGDHSRGVHTKSKWTPLHNLFHHRNKQEVDDKLRRKARVSNVAVKHQGGHFHALVEGLMQHLRHSKKSKHHKGLGNDRDGHRNRKVKQLHWWQMFKHQGGVKLPNKRRVQIGFMSKKQQLKVPKLRQKTI